MKILLVMFSFYVLLLVSLFSPVFLDKVIKTFKFIEVNGKVSIILMQMLKFDGLQVSRFIIFSLNHHFKIASTVT